MNGRENKYFISMHIHKVTFLPEHYPSTNIYPFCLEIFRTTPCLEFDTPITFFIGENGSGKSTLLRAITRKCEIHIWSNMDKRRFDTNPYENELYRFIDVAWTKGKVPGAFFSSELYNYFAQSLDDWAKNDPGLLGYFGGKSLLSQSHGQSVMSFFESRYSLEGLYFLDEPETALSPRRQLELLGLLGENGRKGHAQFIIATHSPILLSCPGAKIFCFDAPPIQTIDYENTDYFTVYRDFLSNRGKYLRDLEGY
ncbi:MAG: AAA family ATPase [Chitinivibrionales bacterium]